MINVEQMRLGDLYTKHLTIPRKTIVAIYTDWLADMPKQELANKYHLTMHYIQEIFEYYGDPKRMVVEDVLQRIKKHADHIIHGLNNVVEYSDYSIYALVESFGELTKEERRLLCSSMREAIKWANKDFKEK